jgi:S1-C subfamily serine protease
VNANTLVTNQHVIESCEYLTDSNDIILDVITVDRLNDLAVLRTKDLNTNYIYLGNDPDLGENVFVAGFPYNFDTLNFTSGAISALVGPEKNITQFQLTAPIQPGNSGGPILDEWGSLVGVTFARIDDLYILESSGTIPQNINYGIKLDVLRDILIENNVKFNEGRKYWFKPSQEQVAQLAKESTVLINCYK